MLLRSMVSHHDASKGLVPVECSDQRMGWRDLRLRLATWNPNRMSDERLRYAETLGYDVLVLPETWGWRPTVASCIAPARFLSGEQPIAGDPAGSVAILLSNRAQRLVKLGHSGSIGSRIVWVRLQGEIWWWWVHTYLTRVENVLRFKRKLLINCGYSCKH